ncbi:MAG: type II toxin-antitoxin system RelE/ParE family toxin [Cyanobacteria bacterium P01_D01_bin.156]
MYDIEYTPTAIADLTYFHKHEQVTILEGIEVQLRHEPTTETRNRKRMRENAVAEWELRISEFRVLYDVDNEVRIVEIRRIAEKQNNAFFFQGKREDV